VKVRFSGVNMRLESLGRIAGFSIHDSAGKPVAAIYKAMVDPAEASTVLLYVSGKLPEKASVWYGFGKDPYCNVHDSADLASAGVWSAGDTRVTHPLRAFQFLSIRVLSAHSIRDFAQCR
jgi:hypothetical protein